MSLEMHTYVPAVDESVIPRWLARMRELGMICEIYPGFSFSTHTGFLPFKLQIQDSSHTDLNGVDFRVWGQPPISRTESDHGTACAILRATNEVAQGIGRLIA